jgi:hypothetical protein
MTRMNTDKSQLLLNKKYRLAARLRETTRNSKPETFPLPVTRYLFRPLLIALGLSILAPAASGPHAVLDLPWKSACHIQGVTVMGDHLFVSCVERFQRKALVHRYDLPGKFPDQDARPFYAPYTLDVTSGAMYHPSGLDHDDKCLWVAAAHYRSVNAESLVQCIDPDTLDRKSSFTVKDHIGGLAIMGEVIVALNWDAKTFYRFSKTGRLLGEDPNPSGIAFQDCQGVSADSMLCSGSKKVEGETAAVVDLLVFDPNSKPRWTARKESLVMDPKTPLGREGFCAFGPWWIFAPEDFPGARLYAYPSD